MNKKIGIVLFSLLSLVMGAIAGAIIWAALWIMEAGIELVWHTLPTWLGFSETTAIGGDFCGNIIFDIIICVFGGLLIGLWQKRNGVFPESLEEVMVQVKKKGGYPYNKIHILLVSALLPLIFGGAVGPEAGLTGVIAGICTLIGDKLKYKGDKVKNIADAGLAASLSVIFGAPFFGMANGLEEQDWKKAKDNEDESGRAFKPDSDRERILSKVQRGVIYVFAIAGGMLAMWGLSTLLGGMAGLPRFDSARDLSFMELLAQWKWGLILILVGIIVAIIYALFNKLSGLIGKALYKYRVISCVIAGLILAVVGHFVGAGRFSGESQMDVLMESWTSYTAIALIVLGIVKLLMVNVSVNLGWKGGTIFPMIYSAVAVGYGGAVLITSLGGTIEGTFAVAITAAAMLGFLNRKPVTVVAILLLCFPITFLPAIIIAAVVSSLIGRGVVKLIGGGKLVQAEE